MKKIEFEPVLVHEWLRRSAMRFPDKNALICNHQRWTYKALDKHTDYLAGFLRDMQIHRHDKVVIFLENSSETVISMYGILKAGAIFIILAGSLKEMKLKYILQNSEACALITHTSKAEIVSKALDNLRRDIKIIWVGKNDQIPEKLKQCSFYWENIFEDFSYEMTDIKSNNSLPQCIDVDLAALIYTSGFTGEPKGVMSTHHNMISSARSIIQYIENFEEDVILNVLPLSFDYGLYQVIMAFMFGGTVILEKSFMYLHDFLNLIAKEKVTGFPIVPTIVAMLLKMNDLKNYDLSTIRYITNTGAALPVEHIRKLQSIMPHVRFFSMFGLTECKRVCFLPPEELNVRPSSVGKAMPNCEVLVVDENGNEVPAGQTGEMIIRGSNVMQGYWKDHDLTLKTFRNGDYPANIKLHSGDYFRKDDSGFLYFVGRKDDMIKSKGERISPREVENILCAYDGVAEAAVIGVPDEILGNAVKAYIIALPSCKLVKKELIRYCKANMETYMVPKYIEFIDKFPMTANGKVDKKKLQYMEAAFV
ncbi:MAG: acyl--CoA ligase [Sedimentisphaerales bacterium]|nr:acyl--CoA ligase [Sedimentisphaerales bacterium]